MSVPMTVWWMRRPTGRALRYLNRPMALLAPMISRSLRRELLFLLAALLGESALCLALDRSSGNGGILTPAAAMARPLIARLRDAGMRLSPEE